MACDTERRRADRLRRLRQPESFMSTAVLFERVSPDGETRQRLAALIVTSVSFVWLFAQPMQSLARDWWTNPEAGHGLLLAPVAVWLAWRAGLEKERRPQLVLGLGLLIVAVLVRYLSGLAAEQFTSRLSLLTAVV